MLISKFFVVGEMHEKRKYQDMCAVIKGVYGKRNAL